MNYYFILFLLLNCLQFIYGMEDFRSDIPSSSGGPQNNSPPNYSPSSSANSSPTNPIPDITFSLVELSFLIRLLKQTDYIYLINNSYEFNLIENFFLNAEFVLDRNELSYLKNSELILKTLANIEEICLYYKRMFYSVGTNATGNIEFISERIKSYKSTLGDYNYEILLKEFNLNLFEDETIEEHLVELNKGDPEKFNILYKFCFDTTMVERNLFIFWNLLAITRKLIREFIIFQTTNTKYNDIIGQNTILNISIFKYMEAHDLFEIKANQIKQNVLSKFEHLFNEPNIKFKHRGTEYLRPFFLPSLRDAENNSHGVLYKAIFKPKFQTEFYGDINYSNILFTQLIDDDSRLDQSQLNQLSNLINQHSQHFYVFYYNLDEEIQRILEYNFINPLLTNIVYNSDHKYLPQNEVNLIQAKPALPVPPHNYPEIIKKIANYYHLTIQSIQQENQEQPESSSRRSQRHGRRQQGRGGGHRGRGNN